MHGKGGKSWEELKEEKPWLHYTVWIGVFNKKKKKKRKEKKKILSENMCLVWFAPNLWSEREALLYQGILTVEL